jgi:hypothetical protein
MARSARACGRQAPFYAQTDTVMQDVKKIFEAALHSIAEGSSLLFL